MTFDEQIQSLRDCLAEEGDGVTLNERSIETAREIIAGRPGCDVGLSCDSHGALHLSYGRRTHMRANESGSVTWAKNAGRQAGKSTPAEIWGVLDAIPDA